MKSVIFAITALATLAAATANGPNVALAPNEPAQLKGRTVHRRMPTPLNQDDCDASGLVCPPGQQLVSADGRCQCKITNGAVACANAGYDGPSWYYDSEGKVCCWRKPPTIEQQNSKPPCPYF